MDTCSPCTRCWLGSSVLYVANTLGVVGSRPPPGTDDVIRKRLKVRNGILNVAVPVGSVLETGMGISQP